jgi:hypothetical protein
MSNGPSLAKVSAKTAAEICKHFPLGDEARGMLREGLAPRQYLDLFLGKELFVDAVRFLAHALPKREAVWWACLCARAVADPKPAAAETAALQTAEKWIADPSEEHRRPAWPAAEAAELGTPAGCAAAAAFWSGGSLGPPHVPVIPPGEYLTAHGSASAVLLAAVRTDPAKAPDKYRKFLALGTEVASGTNKWK